MSNYQSIDLLDDSLFTHIDTDLKIDRTLREDESIEFGFHYGQKSHRLELPVLYIGYAEYNYLRRPYVGVSDGYVSDSDGNPSGNIIEDYPIPGPPELLPIPEIRADKCRIQLPFHPGGIFPLQFSFRPYNNFELLDDALTSTTPELSNLYDWGSDQKSIFHGMWNMPLPLTGNIPDFITTDGAKIFENVTIEAIPAGQIKCAVLEVLTGFPISLDADVTMLFLGDTVEVNAGYSPDSYPAPPYSGLAAMCADSNLYADSFMIINRKIINSTLTTPGLVTIVQDIGFSNIEAHVISASHATGTVYPTILYSSITSDIIYDCGNIYGSTINSYHIKADIGLINACDINILNRPNNFNAKQFFTNQEVLAVYKNEELSELLGRDIYDVQSYRVLDYLPDRCTAERSPFKKVVEQQSFQNFIIPDEYGITITAPATLQSCNISANKIFARSSFESPSESLYINSSNIIGTIFHFKGNVILNEGEYDFITEQGMFSAESFGNLPSGQDGRITLNENTTLTLDAQIVETEYEDTFISTSNESYRTPSINLNNVGGTLILKSFVRNLAETNLGTVYSNKGYYIKNNDGLIFGSSVSLINNDNYVYTNYANMSYNRGHLLGETAQILVSNSVSEDKQITALLKFIRNAKNEQSFSTQKIKAEFYDDSINESIISEGYFFNDAKNLGKIDISASFFDNARNLASIENRNLTFTDTAASEPLVYNRRVEDPSTLTKCNIALSDSAIILGNLISCDVISEGNSSINCSLVQNSTIILNSNAVVAPTQMSSTTVTANGDSQVGPVTGIGNNIILNDNSILNSSYMINFNIPNNPSGECCQEGPPNPYANPDLCNQDNGCQGCIPQSSWPLCWCQPNYEPRGGSITFNDYSQNNGFINVTNDSEPIVCITNIQAGESGLYVSPVTFNDNTTNAGSVSNAVFNNFAKNIGTSSYSKYNDSSVSLGTSLGDTYSDRSLASGSFGDINLIGARAYAAIPSTINLIQDNGIVTIKQRCLINKIQQGKVLLESGASVVISTFDNANIYASDNSTIDVWSGRELNIVSTNYQFVRIVVNGIVDTLNISSLSVVQIIRANNDSYINTVNNDGVLYGVSNAPSMTINNNGLVVQRDVSWWCLGGNGINISINTVNTQCNAPTRFLEGNDIICDSDFQRMMAWAFGPNHYYYDTVRNRYSIPVSGPIDLITLLYNC